MTENWRRKRELDENPVLYVIIFIDWIFIIVKLTPS